MTAEEARQYIELSLDPKEPVFILRARDVLSESVILFWVREAIREGVKTAKIHGAVGVAMACKDWHTKRLPD